MAQLTPRFSSNRTVREYTEQQYLPAAAAYRARAAERGAMGRSMVQQTSARNIMESGKPSRSAWNVATSVDDGRAATIEHVSSKPLTSLTSLWFTHSVPGLAH